MCRLKNASPWSMPEDSLIPFLDNETLWISSQLWNWNMPSKPRHTDITRKRQKKVKKIKNDKEMWKDVKASRTISVLGHPGDPWESEDLHEPLLVHRVRASDPLSSEKSHACNFNVLWSSEIADSACSLDLHASDNFSLDHLQILTSLHRPVPLDHSANPGPVSRAPDMHQTVLPRIFFFDSSAGVCCDPLWPDSSILFILCLQRLSLTGCLNSMFLGLVDGQDQWVNECSVSLICTQITSLLLWALVKSMDHGFCSGYACSLRCLRCQVHCCYALSSHFRFEPKHKPNLSCACIAVRTLRVPGHLDSLPPCCSFQQPSHWPDQSVTQRYTRLVTPRKGEGAFMESLLCFIVGAPCSLGCHKKRDKGSRMGHETSCSVKEITTVWPNTSTLRWRNKNRPF